MDIMMMAMLCGKERARDDWERVLQFADAKLRIVKITVPIESALGIVEVSYGEE
jgi:hypothetical protein